MHQIRIASTLSEAFNVNATLDLKERDLFNATVSYDKVGFCVCTHFTFTLK